MSVRTQYKRALLRRVLAQSIASGKTLLEQIGSNLNEQVDATSDGSIISSTESDGSRVAFSSPKVQALDPAGMAEVWSEFIDLYDRAVAELGGSPADAEIVAQMLVYLWPSKRVRATYYTL